LLLAEISVKLAYNASVVPTTMFGLQSFNTKGFTEIDQGPFRLQAPLRRIWHANLAAATKIFAKLTG